jgi:hypothetical protein
MGKLPPAKLAMVMVGIDVVLGRAGQTTGNADRNEEGRDPTAHAG